MASLGRIARRLWSLLNHRRFERDLEREMAAHRALMEDPRRFGNVLRLREQNADVWGWTWIDDLRQDLRYALRLLHRAPGFALAAVSTLALGIGASTAIFSVAYGVSLRALPFHEPDRLVRIFEANQREGNVKQDVSEATFFDWRAGAPSLASIALYSPPGSVYVRGADQRLTVMGVSPSFFETLGVSPTLGRGFRTEQEYGRSTNEILLSHDAWQRLFGGRRDIAGLTIPVGDDDQFVIIGVMPAAFDYGPRVDAWRAGFLRPVTAAIVRGWRYDHTVARLRPGATIEQARAELNIVADRLAREYPATNAGWTVTVEPLRDTIIGNFGRATWLMLATVAVVLLVACVNVAGLLLVRATARDRETAVREALGAGRSRLVRLWLTESTMLAGLGAAAGLTLAWLGVSALKAAAPPGIPRLDAITIDRPALAVTLISAVLATLIVAAAPLRRRAGMLPVTRRLRTGAPADDSRDHRALRDVLLMAQCAGAVVLVVLAVMLTRSFARLSSFDLGWTASGVVSMKPEPRNAPRTTARNFWLVGWADRLIAQLEATPGVERAAITTSVPLSPGFFPVLIARGGTGTPGNDPRWSAVVHHVTDGYFDLMGISLAAGRIFGPSDRFGEALITSGRISQGKPVAVISQSVARTLWPGQPAIGRSVRIIIGSVAPPIEVVGVVEDLQFHAVGEEPTLHVFVPWTQQNTGNPYLLARVSGDAASALPVVRRVTQSVEPGTGVDRMVTFESLVQQATAQPRFTTRTVAGFGLLALVLAGVGIYGTLSFVVGARTREIAVRLSLGASRAEVLPEVLRRGLVPVVAGGLIGVGAAAALAGTFEGLLFEIEPLDLPSFALGATLLCLAAAAAALGPAYRATHVDPATALRAE